MANSKFLAGTALALLLSAGANAQTTTLYEAVPLAGTEVVRAQHIKPGDVSPEEYQALLDEADRIRAYQSTSSTYTGVSDAAIGAVTTTDASGYQIELYEAPSASTDVVTTTYASPAATSYSAPVITTYAAPTTSIAVSEYPMAKTYPVGTDFSAPEFTTPKFSSHAATTTYAAPITSGLTTTYAVPSAATSVVASAPSISYDTSVTTYQDTMSMSHYVVKGDTLYNIAKRNNISVAALKSANGLSNNNIGLGQTLSIPAGNRIVNVESHSYNSPVTSVGTTTVTQPVTSSRPTLIRNVEPLPLGNKYAVLPKDTLYSIARRACVSVSDMKAVNGNLNPQTLQPGQRLTLPGGHCMR